jgi:hypothetical protein
MNANGYSGSAWRRPRFKFDVTSDRPQTTSGIPRQTTAHGSIPTSLRIPRSTTTMITASASAPSVASGVLYSTASGK